MLEPGNLQLGGVDLCFLPTEATGGRPTHGPERSGDSDFDFLSDRGERIVGTDASNLILTGTHPRRSEILNGSDPNGGNPVFTGVISPLPLPLVDTPIKTSLTMAWPFWVMVWMEWTAVGSGTSHPYFLGHSLEMFENGLLQWTSCHCRRFLRVTVIDFLIPARPYCWARNRRPLHAVALGGGIAYAGMEDGSIVSMDARSYPIDEIFAETGQTGKSRICPFRRWALCGHRHALGPLLGGVGVPRLKPFRYIGSFTTRRATV